MVSSGPRVSISAGQCCQVSASPRLPKPPHRYVDLHSPLDTTETISFIHYKFSLIIIINVESVAGLSSTTNIGNW